MKILLLGGTGAIGVYLSKALAERGDEVYVTSRSDRQDGKISYIRGDAHNIIFLRQVLNTKFDAIVDFMVYNTQEFSDRVSLLLSSTDQYLFLSSARVYANSEKPITENSPRLLDICKDEEYLQTDEYALVKAREENFLFNSGKNNWTIIRPYITYSGNRLQLGVLEKEHWLNRALTDRTVLFQKDIASHFTTLTFGEDVANMILHIIGNDKAFGKSVNVVGDEYIKWLSVFKIYIDVYKNITGTRFKYMWQNNAYGLSKQVNNKYQIQYDRMFDRKFDNSFVRELCGDDYHCVSVQEGISKCLEEFLKGSRLFMPLDWRYQGWADKICRERINIFKVPGIKNQLKYELTRLGIL